MIDPTQYADHYQPDFGIPYQPITLAEAETKSTEWLLDYERAVNEVKAKGSLNPILWGWSFPMWHVVQRNWKKYRYHIILGGNRCVRGDTLIYDPVLKVSRRIDEIKGRHHVYAWSGRKTVIAEASQPFTKPAGEMLEITLSNGRTFVAAKEHRVLSAQQRWLSCGQLEPGCELFLPRSISDSDLLSRKQDAQNCFQKGQDSQSGYHLECHLYDEPPREEADIDRYAVPSPSDAPIRSTACDNTCRPQTPFVVRSPYGTTDDLADKLLCIHSSPVSDRRTILDEAQPHEDRFFGTQSRVAYTPCKSVLRRSVARSKTSAENPLSIVESFLPQSIHGSERQGNLFDCGKPCVVLKVRSVGIDVKWDMSVPAYENYITAGVIHHNSTKSTFCSRLSVWGACTFPGAEVHVYQANKEKSVDEQQRYVWEAIPHPIKQLPTKKGMHHSLTWSQKNGFTDNVCIFPPHSGARRGGYIRFHNYAQYADDPNTAESFKAHLIWLDEECPKALFDTLQYRCVDYHGRIVLSFTTIQGWSPLVQHILGKVRTVKKKFAPILGRELPIIQEGMFRNQKAMTDPEACIYYFWTEDNLFVDTLDFRKQMEGKPTDVILARAYGIPTKSISGVFRIFSKEVNVVKHEDLPWIKNPEYRVTHYMGIDPGGSKPWFMVWMAVDEADTWWVWAEWPDESMGEWAVPGKDVGGRPGPAQDKCDNGIADYVALIRDIEKDVDIYERFIDPRAAAAPKQAEDGARTILTDLDDAELDPPARPAPLTRSDSGKEIEVGLQLLKNKLAYNTAKPMDSVNCPKLYISDRCQNLIFSFMEYTARGGQTEASKDPIDALRMIAVAGPDFVDYKKGYVPDHKTGVY